jgi:hypothetical protein
MRRWREIAGFVAASSLVAGTAAAQSPGAEVALAEMLYRQGRQLMAEGKTSEACPKFAESYRLDAATGTLLNLAACHEAEKKLATAWLEYTEAITLARRDKREDRIRFAQERLTSIEPKLSRLTVIVPPASEVPELEVQVDHVSVRRAAWGVPAPVDPGSHTIEARAKGRKAWSKQMTVDREATNITVTIPLLDAEPVEATAPPPVEPAAPPPGAETFVRPIPTSAYVAGAVTIALTAGAVGTGVAYLSKRSQYDSNHDETTFTAAQRWGYVNLPLTAGAIIGALATTYLYVSRPSLVPPGLRNGAPTTVTPWIGASSGGLAIQGSL